MIQVKESPVPSDTLLTVDLKSGSKIKIGTPTITLDKFFEGNLKTSYQMAGHWQWLVRNTHIHALVSELSIGSHFSVHWTS